jgi:hypothetical protein
MPQLVLLREPRWQVREVAVIPRSPLAVVLEADREIRGELPLVAGEEESLGVRDERVAAGSVLRGVVVPGLESDATYNVASLWRGLVYSRVGGEKAIRRNLLIY